MSLNSIKHVTVIGAGLMGHGIASVTAEAGFKVTLIDQTSGILEKALAAINISLQKSTKKKFNEPALVEKHIMETLSRIKTTTSIESGAQADLIIEAIVENLQAKHELFETLDKLAPANTIFTSNTSSLPISEIASVTQRKDRFGGLHFFNPVPVMKLLEVVRTKEISDETFATLLAFGKAIGKETVECKDTPGFIVNRLLIPSLTNAMHMVDRGDATFQDIDKAMKLGAGYQIGPFELTDFIGLDTAKFILDGWRERFPDDKNFASVQLLDKLVSEGKLGRKTGEGFYKYNMP